MVGLILYCGLKKQDIETNVEEEGHLPTERILLNKILYLDI